MKGLPIFAIHVANFAIVTYEVPADRVLPHLPKTYQLDTFDGTGGLKAFVSTTCFCNRDFRAAGLPYPRHTFNESTYRTYVTHEGRKGVYFFGRYLGTRLSWILQRPIARHTYEAEFDLSIVRSSDGYQSYECRATSSSGESGFVAQALDRPTAKAPFESPQELVEFFTYRLHGFYTSSLGFQGYMPVEHPRVQPVEGSISTARFELWTELGIVSPDETNRPYSVLVIPEVPFKLFAPRPIRDSPS